MAELSSINLNGTQYDLKDKAFRRFYGLDPIETKTYTDVIATANDNNGAAFFYLKVRGNDYTDFWHVKTRVRATVPGQVYYLTDTIFDVWGHRNAVSMYSCMNRIISTSYRAIYYNSVFLASQTGYNNNCGSWIGVNLVSATNNTNASYKRQLVVDLLEYDNCTVEMQNSLVTPTDIPNRAAHTSWYSSSNTSFSNYDAANYGLKQSGDSNTTTITNLARGGGNYVMNSALYRYQLVFQIGENTLTPLNNANNVTGTTKTMLTDVEFNPFGLIHYYNTTTTVNANANVGAGSLAFAWYGVDLRYTFNCGTTLTAHKPLYLTVVQTSNNTCKISSNTPWAQELPTTNDGYWYIYLGRTYSAYQLAFYPDHPVFYHDGTAVRQISLNDILGNATTVNGHTVNSDVPSNAVFTDTTYESKAAASGGTDLSLVTTGEKYNWNTRGIPASGTTGQVLKKSSNSNYATEWADESGGSLIVNFGVGSTPTPDKTFSDVLAAIQNGTVPIAFYANQVYCLSWRDSTNIEFSYYNVAQNGPVTQKRIIWTSTNATLNQTQMDRSEFSVLYLYHLNAGEPDYDYQDPPTGSLGVEGVDDITEIFTWASFNASGHYIGVVLRNGGSAEGEQFDTYMPVNAKWENNNGSDLITIIFQNIGFRNGETLIKRITVSGVPWTYDLTLCTVTYSEEPLSSGGGGGTLEVTFTGSVPTSSHSASEIHEAVQNGYTVFGTYGFRRFELVYSTSISARFNQVEFAQQSRNVLELTSLSLSGASSKTAFLVTGKTSNYSRESQVFYIQVACDDDPAYNPNPTGTMSVVDAEAEDITELFSISNANRNAVCKVVYGQYDSYDSTYGYEIYDMVSAFPTYNTGDDQWYVTATFRVLSEKNGTPVIKTIVLYGQTWTYEYLVDATVTYTESSLGAPPSASGVSF